MYAGSWGARHYRENGRHLSAHTKLVDEPECTGSVLAMLKRIRRHFDDILNREKKKFARVRMLA